MSYQPTLTRARLLKNGVIRKVDLFPSYAVILQILLDELTDHTWSIEHYEISNTKYISPVKPIR